MFLVWLVLATNKSTFRATLINICLWTIGWMTTHSSCRTGANPNLVWEALIRYINDVTTQILQHYFIECISLVLHSSALHWQKYYGNRQIYKNRCKIVCVLNLLTRLNSMKHTHKHTVTFYSHIFITFTRSQRKQQLLKKILTVFGII